MIGTTLDKYEVLQKIGEGGMATVYRGRHATLDRTVAIKILHPHLSSSTRNRSRFAREVEVIESLRHENILEIFDYSGNEVSDCYIVTEFVDGLTLTALLAKRGRLPSEVVSLIGTALCRALGYAHRQEVLHRDVKTDNVMVRNDGTVKLMDFGIARFLDESKVTMTGALVGSPAFMSPEQAKEAPLDPRSDLFALGTVLFYLVTGHLPFTGSNPSLILKNVIEGNRQHVAELAPTMSATLADIIERLMATSPEDRFNTAEDVERHLQLTLSEAGIDPSDPPWSLAAWMKDPDAYEARLDDHLRKVLIEEGRRLLAAGDHLAALRLLNRLLSMDEDNAEVLSLVQSLHGEPAPATGRQARVLAGAGLLVLSVGMIAMFAASRIGQTETGKPLAEADAVLPEPGLPEPEPQPLVEEQPRDALVPPTPTVVAPVEPEPLPAAPRPVHPRPKPHPADPAPSGTGDPTEQGAGEPRTEPKIGTIRLNTSYIVNVYVDGKEIGSSRSDLHLPVGGSYDLELRSPRFITKWVPVTVTEERTIVDVDLQPKPLNVVFDRAIPTDCGLWIDNVSKGTVGATDWLWKVERPDRGIDVEVRCPDGRSAAAHWDLLVREVKFPSLGSEP